MLTRPFLAFGLLAAVACPAGAIAQEFDGVYEYGFCDDPPFVALTIEGAEVAYYETECTLSDAAPQSDPDGAIQYTLTCDYGSGPDAQTVLMYRNADGALVMRNGDLEDTFLSCSQE